MKRYCRKSRNHLSTLHTTELNQKSESPFFAPIFQPKLTVNQPNDIYEQEADKTAEKIMHMPADENHFFKSSSSLLQRKCSECEKEEKLQMKSEEEVSSQTQAPSIINEVISSTGQPLDVNTRNFFEPRFNYDFSNIKVHTDSAAANSAKSIKALAYTSGK